MTGLSLDPLAEITDRLSDAMFASLPEVAPGVHAAVRALPDHMEVVAIRAAVEGDGRVGRWLDRLPTEHEVWVPLVTSERLAGMLRRRGFHLSTRILLDQGRQPVYVREAS